MKEITREDIAMSIAEKHNISKNLARRIVKDVFFEIQETVAEGGRAKINKFGNFEHKVRKEREGFNVAKGEKSVMRKCIIPTFSHSPKFKEIVEERLLD